MSNVTRLQARLRTGRMGCPQCKQPLDSEFCPRDGFPAIPFDKLDLTDLLQGSTLDSRYSLLYRIGRGGMADVYAAWDSAPRAEVAVKVVRPELTTDESIITRFKREAAAISRLDHPHIIKLTGAGRSADGLVYLVLERLVGRTLEEFIQQDAPVEPSRAALLLAPLCDALQALHDLGIMHRDLKPANIFLSLGPDGRETIKLLDFGIARRLRSDPVDDRLAGGKVLGSVCYAAPEIARKGTLDQRTDLYSIGVLLHELLTGQLPFDAPTPLDVLRKQVEEDIPPLPEWVPAPYRALTFELLAKNPDFRPPDSAEVAARLRDLAHGITPVAPHDLPPELLEALSTGAEQLDDLAALEEHDVMVAASASDVYPLHTESALMPLPSPLNATSGTHHRPIAAARKGGFSRGRILLVAGIALVTAATLTWVLFGS